MTISDPHKAQSLVLSNFIDQYLQVVTTTILVYDSLITMDNEINYFWKKQSSRFTNFLYFTNRYAGIFGALAYLQYNSLHATTNFQWSNAAANNITIIIVDYILMLRVLALWQNDQTLSHLLRVLLVLEAIAKITIFIRIDLIGIPMAVEITEGLSFCGPFAYKDPHLANLGVIDWMLPAIVGLLFFILALYKGVRYWKSPIFKSVHLVKILIEDQAFYYAIALFCSILNIVQFKVRIRVTILANIFSVLGNPSFQCLLGSRLFFNLKEAAMKNIDGSSNRSKTLGDPVFVDPLEEATDSDISDEISR